MAWNWESAVCVITRGDGLLGRGMALTFAEAGADVVLSDLNLEAAERVSGEVEALGRRARPCRPTWPIRSP